MRCSGRSVLGWLTATALAGALLACSSDSSSVADAAIDSAAIDDGGADSPATDIATDVTSSDTTEADPGLVVTASGPVRGTVRPASRAFLGIPYAAPPVGERRWARPEPAQPWTEQRDATAHGPSCPQPDLNFLGMPSEYDEDCLLLSVWTPNPAPQKAPVMVWFYGGGFVVGGANTPLYDGGNLAGERGVVVVGVNYRLGSLGFFAHPELPEGGLSYGILDQQQALRWVKDNIAAFGGDPDNVTIFGESAGSMSVCAHLVAPQSAGLFHRAVMQSGSCMLNLPTREEYGSVSQRISEAAGCKDAADELGCLRGKSGEELATALPIPAGIVFGEGAIATPFLDGVVLTGQPRADFAAGKASKVPVVLGTTKNEGTFFVVRIKAVDLTESDYAAKVKEIIAPTGEAAEVDAFALFYPSIDADAVLAAYPAADFASPADALAELLTDALFVCPTRAVARAIAAQQPAYLYHFTFAPSYFEALNPFFRVSHGSELPFVFGNHPLGFGLAGDEKALSEEVMGYWTRFASSGDPNGGQAAAWPGYDATKDEHLVLDLEPASDSGLKKEKCDFWATQVAPP